MSKAEKVAAYYKVHPEKLAEAQSKYRKKYRLTLRKRAAARRAADLEGHRKYSREWHRKNALKSAELRTRHLYAMSLSELNRLIKHHKKRCWLCGVPPKKSRRLCVDHNHATGEIRGMLCISCNQLLRRGKDNVAFFKRVIAYLKNPPARKIKIQGKGRINPKYRKGNHT